MSRKDPQLNLRLPAELKDMLENAATASNRSVTAETVERIRSSFEHEKDAASSLFLITRSEMRQAQLEIDALRYYTHAMSLFDSLENLYELYLKNTEQDTESSGLKSVQELIEKSRTWLHVDAGKIDSLAMATEAMERYESLKKRSDLLMKEVSKKYD